jgi:hypothetical protein
VERAERKVEVEASALRESGCKRRWGCEDGSGSGKRKRKWAWDAFGGAGPLALLVLHAELPQFLIFVFRCQPAPLALALVLHHIQRGTLLARSAGPKGEGWRVGVVVLCVFCSRSVPVPTLVVFSFDSVRGSTPCIRIGQVLCYFSTSTILST